MRKRKPLALAGIGLTAIAMFLLTPVFLLALAGCGSTPHDAGHEARHLRLLHVEPGHVLRLGAR